MSRQTPVQARIAALKTFDSYILSNYCAWKFEADATQTLTLASPAFVRGGEGSAVDAAVVFPDGCDDPEIVRKLRERFFEPQQRLTLDRRLTTNVDAAERYRDLHKLVLDLSIECLEPREFKFPFITLRGSNEGKVSRIYIRTTELQQGATLLLGFPSHKNIMVSLPMGWVAKNSASPGRVQLNFGRGPYLGTSIHEALLPYVYPRSHYAAMLSDRAQNSWTKVAIGSSSITSCALGHLQPRHSAQSKILGWINSIFTKHNIALRVEETRYYPLTCDGVLLDPENGRASLLEVKSSGHGYLERLEGCTIPKYRLRIQQRRNEDQVGTFEKHGGRFTWLLIVLFRSTSSDDSWDPAAYGQILLHHLDIPCHWWGSREKWLMLHPEGLTLREWQAFCYLNPNDFSEDGIARWFKLRFQQCRPRPQLSITEIKQGISDNGDESDDEVEAYVARPARATMPPAGDGDQSVYSTIDLSPSITWRRSPLALHQDYRALKFQACCRQSNRKRGMLFSLSAPHATVLRCSILIDHRWTQTDCKLYDSRGSQTRPIISFPPSTKWMAVSFAPLWHGHAFPPDLPAIAARTLIHTEQRAMFPPRRLLVLEARQQREFPKPQFGFSGSHYVVPSGQVNMKRLCAQWYRSGHGMSATLDPELLKNVLEAYLEDSMADVVESIQQFWDGGRLRSSSQSTQLNEYIFELQELMQAILEDRWMAPGQNTKDTESEESGEDNA